MSAAEEALAMSAGGERRGEMHAEVAIVGAGMVGAALACRLGEAGAEVALVDAREALLDPEAGGRGQPAMRVSALTPVSRRLLERLGAGGGMARAAARRASLRARRGWRPWGISARTTCPWRPWSAAWRHCPRCAWCWEAGWPAWRPPRGRRAGYA